MKVFVSHEHNYAKELAGLKSALETAGISVFLAHEDIEYGQDFMEAILRELQECDVLLLIGHKDALTSCFVQQEIGAARIADKQIIATLESGASPDMLGFIKQQQAIKFKTVDDLYKKIFVEIAAPKYSTMWNTDTRRILKSMNHPFTVAMSNDTTPAQGITLVKDDWNDYGYYTAFTVRKGTSRLGWTKIGFQGQETGVHTATQLPKMFFQLPDNFFSIAKLEDTVDENESESILRLLNDVSADASKARAHLTEGVLEKSLFRDRPSAYDKLKEAATLPPHPHPMLLETNHEHTT